MFRINVYLIGTAQWYLENEGPEKKENPLDLAGPKAVPRVFG